MLSPVVIEVDEAEIEGLAVRNSRFSSG